MVEITEDLTTCTKEYFLNHIKYYKPFTINYKLNDNTLVYPINIVYKDSNSLSADIENLYNLNKIYSDAIISIIYASKKYEENVKSIDLNVNNDGKTNYIVDPSDFSYT